MGRKLSKTNKLVNCKLCGKLTHSDVQGMGVGLCPECLHECEMSNQHDDGQHDDEPCKDCPWCAAPKGLGDSPENVYEEQLKKDKEAGL